jgi:hypothetical protein
MGPWGRLPAAEEDCCTPVSVGLEGMGSVCHLLASSKPHCAGLFTPCRL